MSELKKPKRTEIGATPSQLAAYWMKLSDYERACKALAVEALGTVALEIGLAFDAGAIEPPCLALKLALEQAREVLAKIRESEK